MPSDKQLARIEVFNSLAVTAPQIELDRLLQRDLKAEEGMLFPLILSDIKNVTFYYPR